MVLVMHRVLQLQNLDEARLLFGKKDRNLHSVRERFGVRILTRSGVVRVEGEEPGLSEASEVLEELLEDIRSGVAPTEDEFASRLRVDEAAGPALPGGASSGANHGPQHPGGGAPGGGDGGSSPAIGSIRIEKSLIQPKTSGQRRYLEAIRKSSIVFCIGPAGTGKTYLAVAMALHELARGTVGRIILARPAVEAGENLGFLPGDFQAKINPYLRPLYDALFSMVDPTKMRRYVEKELIEIVPLAYMRGRTLDNAFIILDEGQNATAKQMKMFLTRMGNESKIVVTGDVTQIDLPGDVQSGLVTVRDVLDGVKGVTFVDLMTRDIVRHPIVQDIVDAFHENEQQGSDGS